MNSHDDKLNMWDLPGDINQEFDPFDPCLVDIRAMCCGENDIFLLSGGNLLTVVITGREDQNIIPAIRDKRHRVLFKRFIHSQHNIRVP